MVFGGPAFLPYVTDACPVCAELICVCPEEQDLTEVWCDNCGTVLASDRSPFCSEDCWREHEEYLVNRRKEGR